MTRHRKLTTYDRMMAEPGRREIFEEGYREFLLSELCIALGQGDYLRRLKMINRAKMFNELNEVMDSHAAEKVADLLMMLYEDLRNTVTQAEITSENADVFVIQITNTSEYCRVCKDLKTVFNVLSEEVSDRTFINTETKGIKTEIADEPLTMENLENQFQNHDCLIICDDGCQTAYSVHKCNII